MKPWEGVLKAYNDPPICVQRDPFRRDFEITGSEDCLFLVSVKEFILKNSLKIDFILECLHARSH